MRNFWRAVKRTFKYRFAITITLFCAIFLAFFWGANISAVYPLVQVSFQGETIKDYWKRQITDIEKKQEEFQEQRQVLEEKLRVLVPEGTPSPQKGDPNFDDYWLTVRKLDDLAEKSKREDESLQWFERFAPQVERYAPKTPYGTVAALMILVVIGTVLKSIFTFFHTYYSSKIGNLGVYEIREEFFSRAINFEVDYYSQRGVSDTMSRFTGDTGQLAGGISIFYGKLVREPLKIIACLLGAAWISWPLLLMTFVFIPIIAWTIGWLARKIKKVARNAMKEMVFMYARIGEAFSSIRIIKVFNQEPLEREKFRQTNRANYERAMKSVKYGSLVSPMTETLGMATLVTAILLGAYLVITGETRLWGIPMASRPITLGGIILFYGFLIGAADPARRLSDIFVNLQSAIAAADRVYEVVDRENTIPEIASPIPFSRYRRNIRLENVRFSYDLESRKIARAVRKSASDLSAAELDRMGQETGQVRYALDGVSLDIPFGETLAVIGPSGCGKSTLLSLVPRFIDPSEGVVRIDDIPLTDIRLFDLRNEIGLITQNPVLFDGTVRENIEYGNPNKTFDEVVDAAKRAYAHDFIVHELKNGYDTPVGPHGGLLSGGQMQRISIARAILKNPRILLLDEATSQIDMKSELLFHDALKEFVGNRTTIIVTHRTGALALADRIVLMNEGRIERIGTHQELLTQSDYYASLFVNRLETGREEKEKGGNEDR